MFQGIFPRIGGMMQFTTNTNSASSEVIYVIVVGWVIVRILLLFLTLNSAKNRAEIPIPHSEGRRKLLIAVGALALVSLGLIPVQDGGRLFFLGASLLVGSLNKGGVI